MSVLANNFNAKQLQALKSDARILVLHGAKRAGKTYALIMKFLIHAQKFRNKKTKFIIAGASMAAIQSNVLDDMAKLLGRDIKLNKHNNFELFGNTVLVRSGMTSDAWKTVRGFSSSGALLNEGTALHDKFIKECISRCSEKGSKIFIDTNPENPSHTIKVDYIDKAGQQLESGQLNIEEIQFSLFDNHFLDPEYVESIKMSTPSGMFTDRDIYGKWVNAQGVIYKDFCREKNIVKSIPDGEYVVEYIGGIDWGFEHNGCIIVLAYTQKGNYYLIDEVTKQHMYVEQFWLPVAQKFSEQYPGIIFFADHARPEYIDIFIDNNIEVFNADKSVVPGIEKVASFMKQKKFKVLESVSEQFLKEVSNYVWSDRAGEEKPVKKSDDLVDCVRYGLFSHQQKFV